MSGTTAKPSAFQASPTASAIESIPRQLISVGWFVFSAAACLDANHFDRLYPAIMESTSHQSAEQRSAQQPEMNRTGQDAWLEQFVTVVAQSACAFWHTFATLLTRPSLAPKFATSATARPRTFLIAALLISGLMIQTVMLYRGRLLDGDLFEVFTVAIESWGLRELLLMTVPPLMVVWLVAAIAAWLADIDRLSNLGVRFFEGLCHAVGVQLMIVALAALSFILLKAIPAESGDDYHITRDYILAPILIAVILSGFLQVQKLLFVWGRAGWTRRLWLRMPFAALISMVSIGGVLRISGETFDFRESQQLGARLGLEEWSERARVLVDVLDSRVIPNVAENSKPTIQLEQQIALTNVANLPHAISFPKQLRIHRPSKYGPTLIGCRPKEPSDCAGWVLKPGETTIVAWVLNVPVELLDSEMTVATFPCVEINVNRWHDETERPLGHAADCYLGLRPQEWSASSLPSTYRAASAAEQRTESVR